MLTIRQGISLMDLEIITKRPHPMTHSTPLLLIHGAWHGAWCWENFLPYFAGHGFEVHALSLRGHGRSEGREAIRWFSISEYADDVSQLVRSLSSPPVLIGHSMGGYITQKYLETHNLPAGVLLASIPVSGIFKMTLRFMKRRPWSTIKTLFLMNPWYLVNSPALAKEAFFSDDFPDEEMTRLFPNIQPESFRVSVETTGLNLPRPKKVKTPLLVLAAEKDRVFSLAEQRATAKAYNTEAHIFPDMAHNMMLEKSWQKVADKIIQWLTARGL
jgi:pimeloyl-ACP methyl ester carboxylesterase